MSLPADLDALLDDLRPAAVRAAALSRRVRISAAIAAAALLCTGAALAAEHFLGEPAPPGVQGSLHAAARFVEQRGLEAETARVVATAPDATLYGVGHEGGTYCAEVVGAAHGLVVGGECEARFDPSRPGSERNGISLPGASVVVEGAVPPAVVWGKLHRGAAGAEAILGDGTREPVSVGLDGFWIYEPSDAKQAVARRAPIEIEERSADGTAVWTTHFEPPLPLAVEGTPIERISGTVEIGGAATVEIRNLAGFGRPQTIQLASDGSFTWSRPAGFREPSLISVVVLDRSGHRLAETEPYPETVWRHWLEQAQG